MSNQKVIVLTGASRGIGLAIAKYLLKDGHKLVLVARTPEPLERLKVEYVGAVEVFTGDLKDFEVGPKVINLALKSFSRIDSLVINHGTLSPVKRIADSTPEEWRSLYDITPALPHLRKTNGRIILTSSGAATGVYSTWGAYGSSKAALNHLAMTLAAEEPGVTTVSIRPGVVDTDMQAEVRGHNGIMDEKDTKKFKSLHEEGKLLKPEQPGNVMARLAIRGEKEFSGKFLSWDSKELEKYQNS